MIHKTWTKLSIGLEFDTETIRYRKCDHCIQISMMRFKNSLDGVQIDNNAIGPIYQANNTKELESFYAAISPRISY